MSSETSDNSSEDPGETSLRGTIASMLRSATFRQLLYSYSVLSFFDYGRGQWFPAFYMRSFGLNTGEVGLALALIYGGTGLFGFYLGGWLVTRFVPNDERLQLRLVGLAYVVCGVLSAWGSLTSSLRLSLILGGVGSVFAAITVASFFSILQEVVPVRMRAQSTAFVFLVANLIGMGAGPLAVGLMSDALHSRYGEESLRYTLLVLCSGYVWCAWHTWRGGDSVARDLAEVGHHNAENAPIPVGGVATKVQGL